MCPHVYLEEATGLNENKGDRDKLLKLGIEMLAMSDECFVFDVDGISSGMKGEIDFCNKVKKPLQLYKVHWGINSVRIECQPSKLEVTGSNPVCPVSEFSTDYPFR